MVILVQKLGRSLKFSSKLENRSRSSKALSASLHDFRAKISNFISQNLFKPDPGSETLSLACLSNCFELIHVSNNAFAKMVAEVDYPISKWGAKAIEEYLNYTLNMLDLLNFINCSVSHLNQARVSISHALSLTGDGNKNSAANYLKKVPAGDHGKDFKLKSSIGIEELKSGSEMEHMVLQALIVLKKIGFLALGFLLSGLSGNANPYMEVRKSAVVSDDQMIEGLNSRFCEKIKVPEEVKEVNGAVEYLSMALPNERCDEAAKKLKRRMKAMETMVDGIEKEANSLFSEVLSTRNKLIDNLRLTEKSP